MSGAKILPPIVVLELEGWVLVIVVDRENPFAYELVEIINLFDHYGADRAMGAVFFVFCEKKSLKSTTCLSLTFCERPGWRP